jgi:hypothetical protein
MNYIDGGIICDTPAGRLEGAGAYWGFLGPVRADRHRRADDRRLR